MQRILHVDDEPDIREIVRMSLSMVGRFDVEQCASGVEALDKAEAANPDLIILDVMMPHLDGEETFVRLREIDALADTPIIFMTARASSADYQKLRDLGAADIVIKPFDPMTLPDQLREIWARSGSA
ncbi:response regulator [Sinisalibacter aestuarii]|uniref:Response regulator n=1 Tax=Sinisalibacter aestuarii TaxID=2949426 RepID=A0ABQ5LQT0_9RHOB|nr:response regulator [Sinisalibacter aestuarii]